MKRRNVIGFLGIIAGICVVLILQWTWEHPKNMTRVVSPNKGITAEFEDITEDMANGIAVGVKATGLFSKVEMMRKGESNYSYRMEYKK